MKKILTLLLAGILLVLSACGDKDSSNDSEGYTEGFLGDTLSTYWFDFTVEDAYASTKAKPLPGDIEPPAKAIHIISEEIKPPAALEEPEEPPAEAEEKPPEEEAVQPEEAAEDEENRPE